MSSPTDFFPLHQPARGRHVAPGDALASPTPATTVTSHAPAANASIEMMGSVTSGYRCGSSNWPASTTVNRISARMPDSNHRSRSNGLP